MHSAGIRALAMAGGTVFSLAALAAPRSYTVTQYQPAQSEAHAADINDLGHIAGHWLRFEPDTGNFSRRAFLSTGSQSTDLTQAGVGFTITGLNNRDQLVGTTRRDFLSGVSKGYLFSDGQVTDLGSLGGPATVANAINDAGQIAGYSSLNDWDYHAFTYQHGVMRDLGTPAGGSASGAFDINASGQVVGEWVDGNLHKRAFLYDGGAMRDLGTLGGNAARATDISNAGHVLGLSETAAGAIRNFLYFNGAMTELATFNGEWIQANGVNSAGDVVGSMPIPIPNGAFLWTGGTLYKLADYIDPAGGWRIDEALAINDRGQISAFGCNQAYECGPVVLTPVPEPQVAALLLAGLGLVGARAARQSRIGQRSQS